MDMREYNQAKEALIALLQANPALLQNRVANPESGAALAAFAWGFIDTYVVRFKQVEPIR